LGLFRSHSGAFFEQGFQRIEALLAETPGVSVPMALNSVDLSFEKQTVTIKLHRAEPRQQSLQVLADNKMRGDTHQTVSDCARSWHPSRQTMQ
jgi:hypothetical protein